VACGLWELSRGSPALVDEFFDRAPDGLVVVDETGRIQCVNARTETLFRIPREGLLDQPIELLPEWLHHRHSAQRVDYVRHPSALSMGTDPPLVARRADGSEFPVEIVLSSVEIERRQMALVVVRDISARKRLEQQRDEAEEELRDAVERVEECTREVLVRSRELDETNRRLREANKEFAMIYERGGIFVGHLNLEGVIVDANPACVEGLGFARADSVGRPTWQSGLVAHLARRRPGIDT
jgi:PAS domain S-box-containing protein